MYRIIYSVALISSVFGQEINTTDEYGHTLEHFRIQNINPAPILVHELGFSEYEGDYLLQERYFYDIPEVPPFDETVMIPFFFADINNTQVVQKWSIVLRFENNTYITKEEVPTRYGVDDQGHLSRIVLDLTKDRMTVKPPIADIVRRDLKMMKGNLNDTTHEALLEGLAHIKRLLADYIFDMNAQPKYE